MTKNKHLLPSILGMIKRDLLIQWRDRGEFLFRVAMLPFILIVLYGYVLPKNHIVPSGFTNNMFTGMMGMSIVITGIHGTAIPLTMDFHMSREIEDRLQAPISHYWVAVSKLLVGMIEAWIGMLIVLPISIIFMGSTVQLSLSLQSVLFLLLFILLASLSSASLGLLVGTFIKPQQIAAMFPGLLMPIVFTGGIFFTWKALGATPIFQYLTLINPLLYVNEGLRWILMPQLHSLPIWGSLLGLLLTTAIMLYFGVKRFLNMAQK